MMEAKIRYSEQRCELDGKVRKSLTAAHRNKTVELYVILTIGIIIIIIVTPALILTLLLLTLGNYTPKGIKTKQKK